MELDKTLKMAKPLLFPIDVRDGIQGLVSAREMLYHWARPSPEMLNI